MAQTAWDMPSMLGEASGVLTLYGKVRGVSHQSRFLLEGWIFSKTPFAQSGYLSTRQTA